VNFTSNALLRERLLNGYDKLTLCVMIFCLWDFLKRQFFHRSWVSIKDIFFKSAHTHWYMVPVDPSSGQAINVTLDFWPYDVLYVVGILYYYFN
jgi:hypothetical protein